MEVDSLEFTLNSVCGVSGTIKSSSSGKAIACAPWGFTWSASCNSTLHFDGYNLAVTFTDAEHSTAVLDIMKWTNNCTACGALNVSGLVGIEVRTWGRVKASYDPQ
jgi:hypothetical protein